MSAGVVLPLSETGVYRERFGTRHRAALGITEQTDAIAVVVSEETGSVSLVERGRIVRDLDEPRLGKALVELLEHSPLTAVRCQSVSGYPSARPRSRAASLRAGPAAGGAEGGTAGSAASATSNPPE